MNLRTKVLNKYSLIYWAAFYRWGAGVRHEFEEEEEEEELQQPPALPQQQFQFY